VRQAALRLSIDSARMCGICGIASRAAAPDLDRLAAMSASLAHRGPDSGGEYANGPVALAARRLSIIDLAGGDQPIVSEDGVRVVVQNGEIYNYPSCGASSSAKVTASARTATPRSISICTSVTVPNTCGGSAGCSLVALWDAEERRLVLARDRYGNQADSLLPRQRRLARVRIGAARTSRAARSI